MKLIHVAAAVLNQVPLDWDGNLSRIRAAMSEARSRGVQILCLPEMCICGYGCEDAFFSPGVQRTALDVCHEVCAASQDMIVTVGLPLLHRGSLFNTVALIADGRLWGFVAKQNLAGDGIHYEPRWFKPWPHGVVSHLELDDQSLPIGDLVFDCDGIQLGFEICEDAWVADRPGSDLAKRGVDLILNPSASHFAFGKHEVRQRFVLEGSRAFHVGYVYANLVGNEAGRAIYDGDAMIASCGRMLANGPRFSFADFHLTEAVLDVDKMRMQRSQSGARPTDLADDESLVRVDFPFAAVNPAPSDETRPAWEHGPHIKEEEFSRAVSLGLFDYLRKSRSDGFVVSLSGGADSATVATLAYLMVHFARTELGDARLHDKLRYLDRLDGLKDTSAWTRRLLTCVYQSTCNSSQTTHDAANAVATAIGAEFLTLDVDDVVNAYVDKVGRAVGRQLEWDRDDIALQNIQARARAPGVWLLANLRRALLLSTSNRSEAAVGYATMDGDTSGGLSPIAGIDKAFLLHWLRWMEQTGPETAGSLPVLEAVNRQQPTAELRPPNAGQTDEADLMPYEVLDAIERAAIRDKLVPLEVFRWFRPQFEDRFDVAQLHEWVQRFFRLWSRNQWKRERYAPSFHLDDENLDPKTWCRFPILSGGFQRELKELATYFEKHCQ